VNRCVSGKMKTSKIALSSSAWALERVVMNVSDYTLPTEPVWLRSAKGGKGIGPPPNQFLGEVWVNERG
jgi:hypothetical protein